MAATSYQASSSCFPSSSSSCSSTAHDVFLSFRGEDTRKTFTSHLYTALTQAGIRTFLDESELQRGNDISSELLTAIEQSRVSIIVFSKNYASSRWCLDELAKILECKKTFGQLVLPIFYDVDPSNVRHQTGSFANAFAKHRDLEKVEIWRAALTQVATISGWDLKNVANGHESKFILKIVKEVMRVIKNYTYLDVCTHPVGMDSRVEDLKMLLSNRSDSVYMIGIYGMGGVGKTTTAKAVYNMIFQHYECSCFLENVREVSEQLGGLAHLQEKLLSSILMIKKLKVGTVDRGISLMRERLCSKRVLIVLDDLDKLSQVKSLVGGRDWFGSGSTIIITTRDEHLLDLIQVDKKYKAEKLNLTESLELFSWHAFRKNIPLQDYAELSNSIVSYCGGLPLALEVLGSYLYGRNMVQWEDAFEKLKQIPNDEIQNKLRISFDGLDACEKAIFLDIACFFIGTEQGYAMNILDACDFFPKTGLTILREKCLLTINEVKVLGMHDLLRDMGRQIVCEESPREPGKRSRLWFQKDVIDVLKKNKGTRNIEGIILDQTGEERVYLSTQTFKRMHKLRLLNINNVHLTGSFEHIFHELRWLCWTFYPLKSLPSSFHPENLVVLDLQHSKLNILWEGTMLLENLKIIDLSHSKYLTTTPDFTGVPRLEKLKLYNCISLNEVQPSIGLLSRLVYFNMTDCKSLTSLPISICNLSSLQTLDLHRCRKLEGLPDKIWSIEGLNILHTTVTISPYSIGLPPSISSLCSLQLLNLSGCNLTDGDIPNDIGSLFSLKELDLSWNNFCSLPYSLGQLSNLKNLYLRECKHLKWLPELPCNLKSLWLFYCTSLQSLPRLPRSLEILIASDCTSLKQIPNLEGLESLQSLSLENCSRLAEIQGLENLSSFRWMDLGGCSNLETTFVQRLIKLYIEFRPGFDLYLPWMEIPDCFKYQKTGPSISFDMPHINNVPTNHFLGYTICGVQRGCYEIQVVINNRTNGTEWSHKVCCLGCYGEVSWVTYISEEDPTQGGDRIQISTTLLKADHLQVERIGVHLIYESSSLDMMEIDNRVYSLKRDYDHVDAAETSCSLSPKRLKV